MVKIKTLLCYLFKFILLMTFLWGGFIQYILGVPNTLYTLILLGFIFFTYTLSLITRNGKLTTNAICITSGLYILLIILSSLINQNEIAKTILYFIFPLIPYAIFILIDSLIKTSVNIKDIIQPFFKFIAIVQLPVVLIQRFFYDSLIKFNNSNQLVGSYDFMFGTFFIKADHSLGFFLLLYLLSIIFSYKHNENNRFPWLLVVYLCITILCLESNLTKLLLFFILTYYGYIWANKKIRYLGIISIIVVGYIMSIFALSIPKIKGELYFLKNKYTIEESVKATERGYAKRPQIVISSFQEPIKIVGEGPYDYFNIFTGEFKKGTNFSQLIWTYNDLGILGLLTICILTFLLINYLGLDRESNLLLTLIMIMYLFMTNIYSDIAMMFTLLLVTNRKIK